MSETDELVKRLRAGTPENIQADGSYGPSEVEADELMAESADRLEAQATALTASQETIDAQQARIAEMEKALGEMIYETRHLSSDDDGGSHWCKISKKCLSAARTALAKHDTEKEGA